MGVYPEKTIIPNNTCTLMSIVALFAIARIWRQSKYPSTEEWIRIWHIYAMDYYTTIKRNKIVSFAEKWMNLESFIQSRVSQKDKNKYHISTHICGI